MHADTSDTSAAEAALRAYAESFARGDIDSVVALLHVPCTYIRPAGVTVFPDAVAARAGLSAGMEQMRADGYHHTEFVGLASRVLSPDLVAFSGTFVRIGSGGQELNRAGFTYTLRLRERRWRLVCAIVHDPPA
jgi:ketosteroid isomerase-like protein